VQILAAYTAVVLIWSTTPLTIQWSSVEVNFLFGVASRMVIGVSLLLCLHLVLRKKIRKDKIALHMYLTGGCSLWLAMSGVYWGAQYIPSGWISVLFGTTPIVTGLFAMLWLNENVFTPVKLMGLITGIIGLGIMFFSGSMQTDSSILGIILVLGSVISHGSGAVWIKRINAGLDGMTATTGSLLVATPLFVLTWWILDGVWPQSIPKKTAAAILYLGVFGSVIGFTLYYYLLRCVSPNRLALVTLMTPIIALMLGQWVNQEVVTTSVWVGSGIILLGLALYEWGDGVLVSIRF
jgi:drug/metabolite transporter (DMT)-like permease